MTEPFWIGFWGVLGVLGALLAVISILGLGYLAGLFIRASLAVWRRRRRR